MALGHTDLEQLIAEHGPYLYHGTADDCVPGILERGLEPGWSADERTTHVFFGDEGAGSTWAQMRASGETAQIRVDLRQLDPQLIDFDPDFLIGKARDAGEPFWIVDGYLALDENGQPMREPDAPYDPHAEPPGWVAIDLHFLVQPSSAEDTLRSFNETGCLAYRGPVPAQAVSLNPDWAIELVRQGKPVPAPPRPAVGVGSPSLGF